ncbi:TerB family tellurite resistance protein [Ferrimonas balearica]|uniref:tellurite resistance TerB family protein n=1 Tax=Ferrimonas balearica TaxID=44012 RepID=UPI001C990143|nr:TerB family tellurite resistance protein [Ferrimonas balearica]MBY5991116.1 TerB family tellurite resistance protein [Ferrimonas balearica]
MILTRLRRLLGSEHSSPLKQSEMDARLACAALLLEVSRSDGAHSPEEKAAIWHLLQEGFQLSERELTLLFDQALEASEEASDLFAFTSVAKKNLSHEQKLALIQGLWRVAFADGTLDPEEEGIIRKVADLLYVSHSEFIQAKLTAQAEA